MARKYREEVTELALGSLFELIRLENDSECRSNALEAVCALVCADEEDFSEGNVEIAKQTSIQVQNRNQASFFSFFYNKKVANLNLKMSQSRDIISLVMDCIDENEFRVKWAGLRLLTALARESPAEIQQVIQERPTGVSQLVDGVTSQNEILRNASLLLLISVAENNPILQKIIAFENGFEIALNVAAAEGFG